MAAPHHRAPGGNGSGTPGAKKSKLALPCAARQAFRGKKVTNHLYKQYTVFGSSELAIPRLRMVSSGLPTKERHLPGQSSTRLRSEFLRALKTAFVRARAWWGGG